jgi:hypothetical protein
MRSISFVFVLLCFLAANKATGQKDTLKDPISAVKTDLPVSFKISGFVKSDYWYDSRTVTTAREGLFLLFPKEINTNNDGVDLNGEPSFNFSAITSRITGTISGPEAFGAKTSGVIEADFSGVTNEDINGLRLRHAFMKLSWNKAELLLGQWWHPMFATGAVPTVISLNTGAPFQPFIRNPQISLTLKKGNYSLLLAAIAQRDNSSDGPKGTSPDYMRQSGVPNFHAQLIHQTKNTTAGIAADYKQLRPLIDSIPNVYTNERISTYAFMAYFRNHFGMWDIKGRVIYGQNLSEHLLLGGYAQSSIDALTGLASYTPLNHLMSWANIVYGKKVQTGLFGGYAHNLGTNDIIVGDYYGRGKDIKYMYRLAPHISFISGKMQFSTELEYTVAAYGTPDNKGKISNSTEASNIRLLFTAFYFF